MISLQNENNLPLKLAHEFVHHTGRNVFLSGKAGTGKTTFLHRLKERCDKRMVVVAPTGVAAINAGGVTIHSFFQLSFGPQIPEVARMQSGSRGALSPGDPAGIKKFSRDKIRLIRSLDLVVIDEISMVRADVLDAIDEVLRKFRHSSKPFGGVQMLVIGDLFQLSPVVKDDEWEILKPYYKSAYFFNSLAYQRATFVPIELMHIYRQEDRAFIDLLNAVRNNQAGDAILSELNKRYRPDFNPGEEEGYITLTTHNAMAGDMNMRKLQQLSGKASTFKAIIESDFPSFAYPGEAELIIKSGAQVMFIKNDIEAERRFFNGKIGKVVSIGEEEIIVKCQGDDDAITVTPATWRNIRYSVNEATKDVQEEVIGTFTQFPLKLAWAITIHKSQGLTFDKAIIDAQSAFAYGQVYVALSRCRNLEGLVLRTKIAPHSIITDSNIVNYTSDTSRQAPDDHVLDDSRRNFQMELLNELFDFTAIRYRFDGLKRVMEPREAGLNPESIAVLKEIEGPVHQEIHLVAEKFRTELIRLAQDNTLPVDNRPMMERVSKAMVYFSGKVRERLSDVMMNFAFDTDNKEIRKSIGEHLELLQREIFVKSQCLDSCLHGFEVLRYLQARAHADLNFRVSLKKQPTEKQVGAGKSKHPVLYKELIAWRNQQAGIRRVTVSRIIHLKAINIIAELLPTTLRELENVKGIGRRKLDEFGSAIIEMVQTYCDDQKIVPDQTSILLKEKAIKNALPDSKKLSLDLFVMGRSIAEVAKERGLAVSTIEGHLSFFVGEGLLEVNNFVADDKIKMIEDYFLNKENSDSLSEAKSFFGDQVTFGDLRMVLNHLRFLHREKS